MRFCISGKGTVFFSIVGEPGAGKTALLRHLNWRIASHPQTIHKFLEDDVATAYWNLKESEEKTLKVQEKKRFLGVYVRASDLWRITQNRHEKVLRAADLIIESAACIFRRLVREGSFEASQEAEFVASLRELIPTSRIVLLVDSVDLISSASRPTLLSTIYNLSKPDRAQQIEEPGVPPIIADVDLFRVVMTSRPAALYNQAIPADPVDDGSGEEETNFVFLFLDKLFSLALKERLFAGIVDQNGLDKQKHNVYVPSEADAIRTAAVSAGGKIPVLGPNLDEAKIQSKLLRSLRSPMTIFLMAQLQERSPSGSYTPVSVYDMFEEIVSLLKSQQGKRHRPISMKAVEARDFLFPSGDQLDRLASLFGFLYQCFASQCWSHNFSIRSEIVTVLKVLLDKLRATAPWADLLPRSDQHKKAIELLLASGADASPQLQLAESIWEIVTSTLVDWNICHALDTGELLFFDEQLVQFLCSRFLIEEEFSEPIIACLLEHYARDSNALRKSAGPVPTATTPAPVESAVKIFCWQDASFLTHTHWNFVYDLVGTKRGPVWMASRILPVQFATIFDWLAAIRKNDGVDNTDLGQIRFYRLLRGFALQQEDAVSLKRRLNQPVVSPNSPHSTAGEVEVANLKEAFGMTFVSILEDNPSAIIHIEKAPVNSFGCFSQNAINIIVEQLTKLLRTGNIFIIADILLNLDKNKLLSDTTIVQVVDIVVNPDTEYKPLRPALRFLTTRSPPWRHMSVVVGALGARDQDTQDEAAESLEKLGHSSLDTWKRTMKKADGMPPFVLYEEKDWTLLIASTVSLLVDFVDAHLLETDKSAHLFDAPHEPKCRLPQCHALKEIVSLLESDHPGTRLFPYVCLGNTIRSNMHDRDTEVKNIASQLVILDALGRVYRPSVEHFPAVTEVEALITPPDDFAMKCIAYILLEQFGAEVAKFSVRIADLIKSKMDLLQQLSTWLWARLPAAIRQPLMQDILSSTSLKPQIASVVMRDIMYISTRTDFALQQITSADLNIVLQNTILNPLPRITMMLYRAALRYLDRSSVMSTNIDYKIVALETIDSLLDKFLSAISHPAADALGTAQVLLELVLRNLSDMLSYQDLRYKQALTPHLERLNMRSKLLVAYRQLQQSQTESAAMHAPAPRDKRMPAPPRPATRLWFSKFLMGQVLRHLISPDSVEILEMLNLLNSGEAELRAVAVSSLRLISEEHAVKLTSRIAAMMEVEGDAFIRRSYVVLLGSLGMRTEKPIRNAAIEAALKFLQQDKYPVRQELGVGVIGVIGPKAKCFPDVEATATNLLVRLSSKGNPAFASAAAPEDLLLPTPGALALSREEVALLISIIECAPNVGFTSPRILDCMFSLLHNCPDSALRLSLLLSFRKLVPQIEASNLIRHEAMMSLLLKSADSVVRELSMKVVREFGTDTVWRLRKDLCSAVSDAEPFCRKQAIKALSIVVRKAHGPTRQATLTESLEILAFVAKALDDANASVVTESLKFFRGFKSPSPFLGSVPIDGSPSSIRSATSSQTVVWRQPKAKLIIPMVLDQTEQPWAVQKEHVSSHSSDETPGALDADGTHLADSVGPEESGVVGDDTFYNESVVTPYFEKIVALLYKRRFKSSMNIKLAVLLTLGETTLLHSHLASYSDVLSGDNVSNLVDFGDALRMLGPQVLQYIPPIINIIKPGSQLVRNLVRLLLRHERQLDAATCSRLFSIHTIRQMMQNKDATVRKVAVTLMGKKVIQRPRHLPVLVQMWADKNNKVRREVMEALGDLARNYPQFVPWIMETIDTESVSSVLVWRFLSKSWGALIESNITPNSSFQLAEDRGFGGATAVPFGARVPSLPQSVAAPPSAIPALPSTQPGAFVD